MGRRNKIEERLKKVLYRLFLQPIASISLSIQDQYRLEVGRLLARKIHDVGADVRFKGRVHVTDGSKLKIGSFSRIGEGCFFYTRGGLTIGNNCQLSRNVTIYTASHLYTSAEAIPYSNRHRCQEVRIGNSVWIGMHTCILPGVTIGDGAIIGMGSVVSKDIPAGAIYVGAKGRIV